MANEDKSARYHRLRRRASLLGAAWQVAFLVALLVTGASTAIRDAVVLVAGPGLVPVVVLYVLSLAVLYELVQLPLVFYQGVVLERRYGLSTESTKSWWADHFKAGIISLCVLAGAGVGVSWLLRWSPDAWWIAAAACSALVLVLVVQCAPVILPMCHGTKPVANEALRARLLALAQKAGVPAIGVFEWRLADRTRKANAALIGLGRTRRILVSDTLLAGQSDDEIEAVLAHELAHHVHGDIWSAIAVETALIGLGFYLADAVLTSYATALGLDGKTDIAALPLLALAAGAVSIALMPVANALSRAHERRADRYALAMTNNSAAFISAMRRLAARNLAEERPSRLVEVLFHTHPSFADRISAARTWDAGPP